MSVGLDRQVMYTAVAYTFVLRRVQVAVPNLFGQLQRSAVDNQVETKPRSTNQTREGTSWFMNRGSRFDSIDTTPMRT